jgi:hypothetical protein
MVVAHASRLVAVERVRCLECGISYVKPCGGGVSQRNPGCPRCGYVGWISAFVPVSEEPAPRRSAADLPRLRPRRSR